MLHLRLWELNKYFEQSGYICFDLIQSIEFVPKFIRV